MAGSSRWARASSASRRSVGLQFAYATNGNEILEFDYATGLEKVRADYPTPKDLWERYSAARGLNDMRSATQLLPDLLEALDRSLEPRRRAPSAQDPAGRLELGLRVP